MRSRFVLGCLGALLAFCTPDAAADLFSNFELEGDPADDFPGSLPDDWDTVNGTGGNSIRYSGLLTDPPPNGIFFGSGSKDVNAVAEWGCTTGSVRDRDEILDVMAAIYPGNFLYFAGDRYGQEDYSYIGVWFFRNSVSCTPSGSFDGWHEVGDLLLLSEFGYGEPALRELYVWVGDGTGSHGNLDLVPTDPTTAELIVNAVGVASPWPYEPASSCSGCYPPGAFFEGGIDLAALGLSSDFSSFLVETRSSLSVDAQLFDFAVGELTTLTALPDPSGIAQAQLSLGPAAPDPFNFVTEIRYEIPHGSAPSRVNLAVFDLLGRRVRTLVDENRGPGRYRVVWNGTDDRQRSVASGTYFYRIRWRNRSESRRIRHLK